MSIEQEKMIVEALPSLYPLQEFEEKAIQTILDALPSAELSTNLAEVGTDAISRDAVKELLNNNGLPHHINPILWKELNDLPSAQPEIIRCRNCKFASGDSRICMKFGHSPIGELDFCAWAERRTDG